jgi:hypothetical protein
LSPTSGPLARKTVAKPAAKSMSKTNSTTTSKTKTSTKPPVPRGGARRVLINSVDAPPMGKSRKARKGWVVYWIEAFFSFHFIFHVYCHCTMIISIQRVIWWILCRDFQPLACNCWGNHRYAVVFYLSPPWPL